MFDWNDEELTNIIWGEATDGEDHIVPYPDGSQEKPPDLYGDHVKKEQNQEAVDSRPSEQKKPISRTDLHGEKLEGTSQYVINQSLETTEFTVDAWPNLSLTSTAKTEQDSLVTEVSNDVPDIPKHETRSEDKAVSHDNASEIFQSTHDESEQGDFVDYSWANVGSFEDLDRIFSNDDPIFGHANLGNSDELWSSSKNVTTSPEKSLPLSVDSPSLGIGELKSPSEPLEVKADYLPDEKSLGSGLNLFTSNASGDGNSCIENIEYAGGKSKLSVKQKTSMEMVGVSTVFDLPIDVGSMTATNMNKGNRQKKLKGRKKEEQCEIKNLPDLHRGWTHTGNQFIQYDSQFASAVSQPGPSIVFSQKLQFQAPESSQYRNFPSPITNLMHGNIGKQYTSLPILSQISSAEGSQQSVPTNLEVSPGKLNKSAEAATLAMTPQEKIEKLRRRQQMRAMLAIQKQQQQFGNQISSTEYSRMEGEHIEAEEIPSSLPSFDPNSPIEQDDSSTFSTGPDELPLQDSILYRLQEIVGKLDIHIRICIRDSLFRLAQSARLRQFSGDTGSSNKFNEDEVLGKDETSGHKSTCQRVPNAAAVETETNPIDRTVAHLLFYRPPEMSEKPVEAPDSPLLAKILPFKRKETGYLSTNLVPQRPENKQTLPNNESKDSIMFTDGDRVQNNSLHHLNASENTTKKGSIDEVAKTEPPSEC